MASAPILDPTPFYRQPTPPSVRIAYSASTATEQAAAVVDKLPTDVRAMTLDELTIASMTIEVIRTARQLLSPVFYSAFLQWGETASAISSWGRSDEEVERIGDIHTETVIRISDLPAANDHDTALKMYLYILNAADLPSFGSLTASRSLSGETLDAQFGGVAAAILGLSPLIGSLDNLTRFVSACSREGTFAMDAEFGRAITGTFSSARGALSAGEDALLLSAFAGCQREMIEWKRNPDQSKQEEDASIERVDGYEMTLLNGRATTLPGVGAKLRVAFQHLIQEGRWTDLSIVDPADPEFVQGLDMSDMYARLLWGAISDLSAIGSIDMGTQAATVDPHRTWFEERNVLLSQANSVPDLSDPLTTDEAVKAICAEMSEVQDRIFTTLPTTPDGLLVQLIQATQLCVEGHELDSAEAVTLIRNAQQIVGLGTLDGAAFPEDLA